MSVFVIARHYNTGDSAGRGKSGGQEGGGGQGGVLAVPFFHEINLTKINTQPSD